MKLRLRVLWFLATTVLLACSRSTGQPEAGRPEALIRTLAAKPHRLAVVFWPQLSGCFSCDQLVSGVISEWQAAPGAEMVVVSVIPDVPRAIQPWLPGTVVRLKPEDYPQHAGRAPRPRVEVWSGDGKLLLSRSVPNYGSQAELLTEEMLAARSFTAPVAIAEGRQP